MIQPNKTSVFVENVSAAALNIFLCVYNPVEPVAASKVLNSTYHPSKLTTTNHKIYEEENLTQVCYHFHHQALKILGRLCDKAFGACSNLRLFSRNLKTNPQFFKQSLRAKQD